MNNTFFKRLQDAQDISDAHTVANKVPYKNLFLNTADWRELNATSSCGVQPIGVELPADIAPSDILGTFQHACTVFVMRRAPANASYLGNDENDTIINL